MDKKAKVGNVLWDNIIYIILLIIFFVGMMAFASSKVNSAAIWEDFYAKEIAKVINMAEPGEEIVLDVQKATEIAKKNKVGFESIFSFDDLNNEVCVQLSLGRASCYYYFNEVKIEGNRIALAEPVNRLHFLVSKEARL